MKTCEYDGPSMGEARSHPWTDRAANAEHRYYDLKAKPALIRTELEDFVSWAHYPAIEGIYSLLEWLNGEDCVLESNDCAFTGPQANDVAAFRERLQCSGRVMILYRALARNVSRGVIASLALALHHELAPLDATFAPGMIGTTIVPTRYVTLPAGADGEGQRGHQLMISFWAWGNTEPALMKNLERVVKNLSRGLRRASARALEP